MVIGQKILELRTEKGIAQETLAAHIGVSDSSISAWEKEINEPKASYIVALAKFFEVSADYLLGLKEY